MRHAQHHLKAVRPLGTLHTRIATQVELAHLEGEHLALRRDALLPSVQVRAYCDRDSTARARVSNSSHEKLSRAAMADNERVAYRERVLSQVRVRHHPLLRHHHSPAQLRPRHHRQPRQRLHLVKSAHGDRVLRVGWDGGRDDGAEGVAPVDFVGDVTLPRAEAAARLSGTLKRHHNLGVQLRKRLMGVTVEWRGVVDGVLNCDGQQQHSV
mmetsp:Transcript_6665/g.12047  ORF Transcript_6665/g.12047 Transcript_6665/m.12047 type:complete len:211 (+) Transcript_6665:615-1247(+)